MNEELFADGTPRFRTVSGVISGIASGVASGIVFSYDPPVRHRVAGQAATGGSSVRADLGGYGGVVSR